MYNRYKVYCEDEAAYVETGFLTSAPTECPNNAAHTITAGSISSIQPARSKLKYDAIVGEDESFTLPSEAFAAGAKSVFVKSETYVETADIIVPEGGILQGEAIAGVVIVLGAYSIKVEGANRSISAGTVAITLNTKAVVGTSTSFTTLQAQDFIRLGEVWHRIASIESDTGLTLDHEYQGVTLSGASFIGQAMVAGCSISNIIGVNGTTYGLYVMRAFHLSIRDSLFSNCGHNINAEPSMLVEDSAECYMIGALTEYSQHNGLVMKNSDHLLMTNSAMKSSLNHGACMDGCRDIIIDGCYFMQNAVNGIDMIGTSSRVNMTDSIIRENRSKGINTANSTGTCIIDSCTVMSNGSHGIDFDGDNNVVNDCIVKDNGGKGIAAGDFGEISGNQVIDNSGVGIDLSADTNVSCLTNLIKGSGSKGIKTTLTSSDCVIAGNQVLNSGNEGILIDDSDDNIISNNRVSGSTNEGVKITAGATDNIVTGNNLKGNTGTNYSDSGTTTTAANNKS